MEPLFRVVMRGFTYQISHATSPVGGSAQWVSICCECKGGMVEPLAVVTHERLCDWLLERRDKR